MAFALHSVTREVQGQYRAVALVIGVVNLLLIVAGLVLGIIALSGMRKPGTRSILAPALVGTILSLLLLTAGVGLIVVLARHKKAMAAKAARAAAAAVGRPMLTQKQIDDSTIAYPGFVGTRRFGGAMLSAMTLAPDSPVAKDYRVDSRVAFLVVTLSIDSAQPVTTTVVDAADLQVSVGSGADGLRSALLPKDLFPATSTDPRIIVAGDVRSTLKVEANQHSDGMPVFLPADIDPSQIRFFRIRVNGESVDIPGVYLTAQQKIAGYRRSHPEYVPGTSSPQ